ncbi:MAG: DUF3990 domain-containing protein [Bacteroidales bacterium]|jgi:hypothetical protein|nr:DUF3990 domain-containing protein [Bacteroidales bacterium]
MKVYHGSYIKIEQIDLAQCRPNRDFGRGFYVTKFLHHAENWSVIVGRRHNMQGIVSEFEYSESAFVRSICKIKKFEDYNEEWLDFVVMNRDVEKPEPAHYYDIVEGPVADDKVQNRIGEYLKGDISKTDFLNELKYHETTHQICFCTLNSLQAIDCRIGVGDSRYMVNISEPIIEHLIIDLKVDEKKATDLFYTSQIFINLSDKTTELYKKSWQEIYELLKRELNNK